MSTEQAVPADPIPPAKPSTPSARGRGRNLTVLGGSMLVDGGESSMISGLFPVIRASLGLSLGALGILTAAARLIGVVAGPGWVWLARRTSHKAVLVIATGFWGIWAILAGLAQNFTQLVILYTISAAGAAAGHAIVPEIIGDSFDDAKRGRAVGWLYGGIAAGAAVLAPLIGQLARVEDGWRYGFFIAGGLNVVFGLLIWAFYRDPGTGAAEAQLSDLTQEARDRESRVTWAKVRSLFGIRSYVLLLISRLLSSHLLVGAFGVVLLVDAFGFDNAVAAAVLAPFGIGYLAGTFAGGQIADRMHARSPLRGRIAFLQVAQVLFAVFAYFGTQVGWNAIWPFLVMFGLMGFAMGLNPGVNRPLVMSVVPPELRGAAFAVYVSVVESLGFAVYTLLAGFLAEAIGLQAVFLWLVVGLMTLNGAFLGLLYRPYARDVTNMEAELDRRRAHALGNDT
ncbi:MFS transporter [Pseudonocardia nigra]|uniref:MFS transporter n=1 Tax=Pseudonocardia nigra TaxID=1921578 RepID=UPI001C5D0886|nr:MFS transporter [Pseudonocardia nigra]